MLKLIIQLVMYARASYDIKIVISHFFIYAVTKGLCKVKKIPKIIWKWVGGSRSHLDKKKIGKSAKNKVLRLYNSPLPGGARGAT